MALLVYSVGIPIPHQRGGLIRTRFNKIVLEEEKYSMRLNHESRLELHNILVSIGKALSCTFFQIYLRKIYPNSGLYDMEEAKVFR